MSLSLFFQVSRIKKENIEERLHLRVFRFNNDANVRVPAEGAKEGGHGADVPWWKRAALREISEGVMSNPDAAFGKLNVPVMPPFPEVLGFDYIQQLRQAQLPTIPEVKVDGNVEDSPVEDSTVKQVTSHHGIRRVGYQIMSLPLGIHYAFHAQVHSNRKRGDPAAMSTAPTPTNKKNRTADPASAACKAPSGDAEEALYIKYLASAQALGKTGKEAHREACIKYNQDHVYSASSGTSTPTFPLNPTTVALATDYMSVKSKATKKVQDLAAAQAAVDVRPYKAKRASTTAKPPRDGAANAKKRPRLPPPPLPLPSPPPSPPLGPPDRHLAQERPLKRVKNSAFQLEQALVRNANLKAKAQADVCGGLKVTTSSVFDMTAHLLYPFLQAMKEGKLGGIASAFDADSKVVLSGSKKGRVAEIMAWFSRHGVTEFSLQGDA